jgi:two-component system NtrC family response regulator
VRVLAATNSELAELVEQGTFRRDLLYRLNVVEVRVPPLRERRQDIAPLVGHFVAQLADDRDVVVPDEVLAELQSRPWPGNVRELENACERMVLLAHDGRVTVHDLPPRFAADLAGEARPSEERWPGLPPEGVSLFDVEKRVITSVLEFKNGNVSQAAQYLRIPRHILTYRLSKYGIGKS